MKDKLNITLDKGVKDEFTKACEKLAIKRSRWLENKMKEFIKESKEGKLVERIANQTTNTRQ